jgi:TadE-like protein
MCVRKSNSGRRLSRIESGQSLIEFAFILIPFLLVTIGVVEIGRAWSVKQAVTNAAREGTRILILQYGQGLNCLEIDCSSAESVKTAAMNTIKFHLSGSGLNTENSALEINFIRQQVHSESDSVTTEPLLGEMTSGDLVGIAIKYKYVSTVQALITTTQGDDNTIDMLGTCIMRHE